ncbi:unnamed protein product [Tenebrio molitor]|nr:unnamed protein product [Tenebrio molitor]
MLVKQICSNAGHVFDVHSAVVFKILHELDNFGCVKTPV